MKSRKYSVDSPTVSDGSIGSNKERRCVKQLFAHLLSICVSVNYYSHPGLLGASSGFNAISLVGT